MSVPHLPGTGRLHTTESSQSLSDLFPRSELTRLQTGSKVTVWGLPNTNNKASGLRPHLQEACGSGSSTEPDQAKHPAGSDCTAANEGPGQPGAGNCGGGPDTALVPRVGHLTLCL